MRRVTPRLRTAVVAGIAGVTTVAGLAALTIPARADSTLTFSRLAGNDRFATAGDINLQAFPSGANGGSVLLADGLAAHATDALAAGGFEGVSGVGVLLTDNTNTVPQSTLTALSQNKVKKIDVIGGTASVSQAQISQLTSAGYSVVAPFQGTTRYETMQKIDDSLTPSQIGADASGLPTAILASGDQNHYIDALSAGPLAYAKHFPIILTNSTGTKIQPEAQQVITQLGIKDLIVVGGTSSIPPSQYSSNPGGITQYEVESGSDRSATSVTLADYAISQKWLGTAHMDVARGDDGADALAGAAFGGVNSYPTVVTDSPTADGSAPSFATEHANTLTGTSYVFGGTSAVSASQVSDMEAAGGAAKPATAGAISPTSSQQVNSVSATSFSQGGLSYTYGAGDTYQLMGTGSGSVTASCQTSTYAVFQASLTQGDVVTGTYAPGGASTFCLNDQAPNPPSSVTATANTTAGGVTLTWAPPSSALGDGVTGYQIWRAQATAGSLPMQPPTCPSAYSTAPGTSPQNTPSTTSGWATLSTVAAGAASNGTYTYTDSVGPGAGTTANEYCYAVSSMAPSGSATAQTGTARPANASQTSASTPAPVTPGNPAPTTAPTISSVAAQGHTITVNFNEQINPATVDANDFTVTGATSLLGQSAFGTGSTVYVDLPNTSLAGGAAFGVSVQTGSDSNSVCAANSTTICAANGATMSGSATAIPSGALVPTMTGVSVTTPGSVVVTYSIPVDCSTVDAGEYKVMVQGAPNPAISKAACTVPSGGTPPVTSNSVTISAAVFPGPTTTVTYAGEGTSTSPYQSIIASNSNTGPSGNANDGQAEPNGDSKSG